MDTPADWPFDDVPNVATLTTRGVFNGTEWIATVSRDEDDGTWQFIGDGGARSEQAMIVALQLIFERDASIAEVADLPEGWRAWRAGPNEPWQREPR